MLQITSSVTIDDSEIDERFVRASGPGGQNVNKVATAVELRFDAARSPALDDEARERLRRLAGARMTAEGLAVDVAGVGKACFKRSHFGHEGFPILRPPTKSSVARFLLSLQMRLWHTDHRC